MDDNRKLKIAMLGHKTMPARDSSRGGIEVVVEELSTRMAAQGHDVTCYNRTGCDNGDLDEYKGVKLKSVFTIQKRFGCDDFISIRCVPRCFRQV